MDADGSLRYGDQQTASIAPGGDTCDGILDLGFTRGFISSQAFVDRYGADSIPELLPANADAGLTFVPTHPQKDEALPRMALRIFDHYSFRLAQKKATAAASPLVLHKPPRQPGEKPWWDEDWTDPVKERDRLLFA